VPADGKLGGNGQGGEELEEEGAEPASTGPPSSSSDPSNNFLFHTRLRHARSRFF